MYKQELTIQTRKEFKQLVLQHYVGAVRKYYSGADFNHHVGEVVREWTSFCVYPAISVDLIEIK